MRTAGGRQQQQSSGRPGGKGAGKGGGAGAPKAKFQGSCWKCETQGHRAMDCRKVLVIEGEEDQLPDVITPMEPWLLNIDQDEQPSQEMLLIDSGAYAHVCPPTFAGHSPIVQGRGAMAAMAADGRGLQVQGEKRVEFFFQNGQPIEVAFKVMSVKKPILSVSGLHEHGVEEVTEKGAYLERQGKRCTLQEVGNLFYLPVRLREEGVTAVMMKDKMGPWLLIGWCCEDDSKMAGWFLRAGHAALRLGRPQCDLRDPGHVALAVAKMIEAARRGFEIIIWASLPCRPWSAWQQVNVAISETVRTKIEADREESRRMVHQLARAVRLLHEADVEVEIAYERPRMASGWKEPEIQKALTEMGATSACEFDGCRYGLVDQAGLPVMKPWKVQTSMQRLVEPLSL